MTVVLDGRKADPVVSELEHQLDSAYAPPRIKRGAHPKMHGCVQAEFIVDHDVAPVEFRHGVFREAGRVYSAWVRFSNAFRIQHDLEAETRGMGIKLLRVTHDGSDSLEDPEVDSDGFVTQDFLCATHDAFFLPDNVDYAAFTKATADPPKVVWFYLKRILRLWRGGIALIRGAAVLTRSPLAIPYYSQTPYRLGPENIVKLQVRPVMTPELKRSLPPRLSFAIKVRAASTILTLFEFPWLRPMLQAVGLPGSKEEAEDFCDRHLAPRDLLRRAMMSHLANHDAMFDVLVQPYVNGNATPVNDATRRWSFVSRFEHVATIRIPRQVFWPEPGMPADLVKATKTMVDLGENMSFNPWHGLKAHEPLGDINEARRIVYRGISTFRRDMNNVRPDIVKQQARLYDKLREVVQGGRFDPCSDDRPDSGQ
jgi:hypothetical protein